jgi:hypothetical protein
LKSISTTEEKDKAALAAELVAPEGRAYQWTANLAMNIEGRLASF